MIDTAEAANPMVAELARLRTEVELLRTAQRDLRYREMILKESETLLRTIFEAAEDWIYVKDPSLRFVCTSRSVERLLGVDADDLVGKGTEHIFGEETARRVAQVDRRVLAGETIEEQPSVTVNGQRRTFHAVKVPLLDRDSTCVGLLGVARDITERLKLEELARHSEKMDALGQLAGSIAHDFNNQLGAIIGCADLLVAQVAEPRLRGHAETIIQAARHSAQLTRQLLRLSHRTESLREPFDLHQVLREVVKLIEVTTSPQINLCLMLFAPRAVVVGDSGEIQNALLNLGLNARDAMPDGGEMSFRTDVVTLDVQAAADISPSVAPGDYLRVVVKDTGSGMDEDTLRHAFEPFFSTKPRASGTGLGLATVYGTLIRHRGAIDVTSTPSQGSEFTLLLPLADRADASADGV